MARKKIRKSTQADIVLKARRRCCVCYGLNRDTNLKSGQIAHLDKDNSNNEIDNLAFLCFNHHDEYDSTTSQRKGLMLNEVKIYRDELYAAVGKQFSMETHFGEIDITPPSKDPIAGTYVRIGMGSDLDTAKLNILPIPEGMECMPRYVITGTALWGVNREYGPNLGDLSFIGTLDGMKIQHSEFSCPDAKKPHYIQLTFGENSLTVEEENYLGVYGMNVDFIGDYRKI